jgi:hypothetical protein
MIFVSFYSKSITLSGFAIRLDMLAYEVFLHYDLWGFTRFVNPDLSLGRANHENMHKLQLPLVRRCLGLGSPSQTSLRSKFSAFSGGPSSTCRVQETDELKLWINVFKALFYGISLVQF